MPYANLLHIYDADDSTTENTAQFRSYHESDMKQVGVSGGVEGLKRALDKLVHYEWTFARAIFLTHGSPGHIFFKNDAVNASVLERGFKNRGYHQLFPIPQARLYFGGCNVAEGSEGYTFLGTAASIFLRSMGGVALGQTSLAFSMDPITMLITSPLTFRLITGGKMAHLWGETRYVRVGPGGHFIRTETGSEIDRLPVQASRPTSDRTHLPVRVSR